MLEFAVETAREAGELLLKRFRTRATLEMHDKSPRNLVTAADLEAEQMIRVRITSAFPGHAIVGEEMSTRSGSGVSWHIDPLDGTTNFAFGIPHWSVSIGACDADGEVVGVVYDPLKEELFFAQRGRGAFCNGEKLAVSDRTALEDALIATGFASMRGEEPDHECLRIFDRIIRDVRGLRRLGSAALDLAYVAAGRFDLFYEAGLSSWDMAAGALIVKEAGGVVSAYDGDDYLGSGRIIAGGRAFVEMMRSRMSG